MTGSPADGLEQALQDSKSAFMEIQSQGGGGGGGGGPGGMGCGHPPGSSPVGGGMPGGYPSFRGGYPQHAGQLDMAHGYPGQGPPTRPTPLGYSAFPMNPMNPMGVVPHSSYNPVGGGGPGSVNVGGHHFISPYQGSVAGLSPTGREGE